MTYRCPVCLFGGLPYPPRDYHICPCCGTEFGNDDSEFTHAQLREMWVTKGASWFFGQAPNFWNPWLQLIDSGHAASVPKFIARMTTSADLKVGQRLSFSDQSYIVSTAA